MIKNITFTSILFIIFSCRVPELKKTRLTSRIQELDLSTIKYVVYDYEKKTKEMKSIKKSNIPNISLAKNHSPINQGNLYKVSKMVFFDGKYDSSSKENSSLIFNYISSNIVISSAHGLFDKNGNFFSVKAINSGNMGDPKEDIKFLKAYVPLAFYKAYKPGVDLENIGWLDYAFVVVDKEEKNHFNLSPFDNGILETLSTHRGFEGTSMMGPDFVHRKVVKGHKIRVVSQAVDEEGPNPFENLQIYSTSMFRYYKAPRYGYVIGDFVDKSSGGSGGAWLDENTNNLIGITSWGYFDDKDKDRATFKPAFVTQEVMDLFKVVVGDAKSNVN